MTDTTLRADQADATAVTKGTTTLRADQAELIVVGYRTDGGTPPPGSNSDMLARLKMVMPPWFGQPAGKPTPVLDGLLTGPATELAFVYRLIAFVKQQTRLSTMTGGWLDLFAQDFFGTDLLRKTGEKDDPYRTRIKAALFHNSNTKKAILDSIAEITSATPTIIQWFDPSKTGVWRNGSKTVRSAYWNVNTTANPARWTGPGVWIEIAVSDQETRRLLFVALRRYKAAGIKIYLKFTS